MEDSQSITRKMQSKWSLLPPELQQQVLDFVEFLLDKYQYFHRPLSDSQSENKDEVKSSLRTLGLHAGMGSISEDFDAPLSGAFWLGDDA